ncbi:hypothetical protein GCM10011371_11060 [Novosphingobium marinum]|uniref:Sec-independent protein translocase protein TatB n=1 Tax=Novosphingobium marinum TaxID=1514948 RepID=A0A7Y9XVF6_9SPHN|nr:Sec-independent protein translocase protein TatB [Novosphingobium marinum]NYH95215.1 sec-independent protein translocase protein TatB [Novosphingobium marinum]GGC25243.1 hypothetical protein GCM10011371_11060 [Novosphingobium marinum]
MFDIGAAELLLIVVVAVLVIGPKDLPLAMRTAGRWIGKMRRISGHFRAGIDTMVREAEMEDMEKKWRQQNEAIMKAHPQAADHDVNEMAPISADDAVKRYDEPAPAPVEEPSAGETGNEKPEAAKPAEVDAEPQLPLPPRR